MIKKVSYRFFYDIIMLILKILTQSIRMFYDCGIKCMKKDFSICFFCSFTSCPKA